jgi:hypothetical protein
MAEDAVQEPLPPRLLARVRMGAAMPWVFASLQTEPLEVPAVRTEIRSRLALPGAPQLLLEFGISRTAQATARRPPAELLDP